MPPRLHHEIAHPLFFEAPEALVLDLRIFVEAERKLGLAIDPCLGE